MGSKPPCAAAGSSGADSAPSQSLYPRELGHIVASLSAGKTAGGDKLGGALQTVWPTTSQVGCALLLAADYDQSLFLGNAGFLIRLRAVRPVRLTLECPQ